jgi:hypothetical protein
LLASKENQPAFSRSHESKRGRGPLGVSGSKETENSVVNGVIGVKEES